MGVLHAALEDRPTTAEFLATPFLLRHYGNHCTSKIPTSMAPVVKALVQNNCAQYVFMGAVHAKKAVQNSCCLRFLRFHSQHYKQ